MATLFAELPVGDRWELSATDIATVADNYALGKYRIGTQPLGGAVNGIARIACDQGEWIVRVHRPWTLSARLGGIHAVQDALRTDGHPIPRVLRDTTGATFTRLADRLVEVIEYVPSEGVADDWRRSALAFETLGTLQASLARIAPELLPPPTYSSYATPETALAMLAETDAIF